jgi:hypothetical protein
MRTFQIDNQVYNIDCSDDATYCRTLVEINGKKVNFMVIANEYNQEQIDLDNFIEFISNIKRQPILLPQFIKKSQKVLLSLSEAFGIIGSFDFIEDYEMVLSSVQFKGKTNNLFSSGSDNFSIWFDIYNRSNPNENVDMYGAYIADIEGRYVVGVRRTQQ